MQQWGQNLVYVSCIHISTQDWRFKGWLELGTLIWPWKLTISLQVWMKHRESRARWHIPGWPVWHIDRRRSALSILVCRICDSLPGCLYFYTATEKCMVIRRHTGSLSDRISVIVNSFPLMEGPLFIIAQCCSNHFCPQNHCSSVSFWDSRMLLVYGSRYSSTWLNACDIHVHAMACLQH